MIELLTGDRRRVEYRVWQQWLTAADRLSRRFEEEWEDDPFGYNEATSVGTLAAAAAQAGYAPLLEYVATKSRLEDRRRPRDGRCDFWMGASAEDRSWAFEFKQRMAARTGVRGLGRGLEKALDCARCVRKSEGTRVAGLVVSLYWLKHDAFEVAERKLRLLADEVDFAWRIGAEGGEPFRTYFFFKLVD